MQGEKPWGVVDFFDSPEVLDASITPIPGSGGAFLQVVASLAYASHRIFVRDGIGDRFIGVFVGVLGQERLHCILGTDSGSVIDVYTPRGTRVSLRAMSVDAITDNSLCLQFMGSAIGFDLGNDPTKGT